MDMHLLGLEAGGFGALALTYLLEAEKLRGASAPVASTRAPHFAAKAKSVIFLFMAGGPSQLDMFVHKPELQKRNGQPIPAPVARSK